MGSSKLYYAVVEVSPRGVIVEDDAGRVTQFPRKMFPQHMREGMIFRAVGQRLVRDQKEEHRRLVEARATLKRLQSMDVGGDITT